MTSKKVLLATRPLTPPWDEASKNFAYFLGTEIHDHTLTLLTTHEPLSGLPPRAHVAPIYSESRFAWRSKFELLQYLRSARHTFDITHYLFTPTTLNVQLIKWFAYPTRGKTIQTVATLRDDLYSESALRKLLFADQLITYTDLTKQKLERLGRTNVARIYPGIDLDRYQPRPKNPAILDRLGCTHAHFIVIYPGEYVRLGATDMLTEAWIDFFTHNPSTSVRFVFACRVKNRMDALKKEEVRTRFAKAGLLEYVVFSDTLSDMPGLYNTSDVMLFPARTLEGKFDVPLVIIEAYASGLPVILSDLPEFAEFSNDKICVTIPKDSGTKIIENVAYLKDNNEKREALGREARMFVTQHFNLKNTARQYSNIYASLN